MKYFHFKTVHWYSSRNLMLNINFDDNSPMTGEKKKLTTFVVNLCERLDVHFSKFYQIMNLEIESKKN